MIEDEITNGITNNVNPNETSLAFIRTINYSEDDKIEMINAGYLDREDHLRLDKLKKCIDIALHPQNRNYFDVRIDDNKRI